VIDFEEDLSLSDNCCHLNKYSRFCWLFCPIGGNDCWFT